MGQVDDLSGLDLLVKVAGVGHRDKCQGDGGPSPQSGATNSPSTAIANTHNPSPRPEGGRGRPSLGTAPPGPPKP